jgi:hypothetical protein
VRVMRVSGLPEPFSTLCSRWRSLAWAAIARILVGYIVLHPVSMVVFQSLGPRLAAKVPHGEGGSLWDPIAHSLFPGMLPMGLVFGAVGALIATFYAFFRLTLTA